MKRVKIFKSARQIQSQFEDFCQLPVVLVIDEKCEHYNRFRFRVLCINSLLFDLLSKYRSRGFYVAIQSNSDVSVDIILDTPYI